MIPPSARFDEASEDEWIFCGSDARCEASRRPRRSTHALSAASWRAMPSAFFGSPRQLFRSRKLL